MICSPCLSPSACQLRLYGGSVTHKRVTVSRGDPCQTSSSYFIPSNHRCNFDNLGCKEIFIHNRSSHRRCSVKKGVFRNFAKFTGKHLHQSLFFNKISGLKPATLLKKGLWYRCFPVNFAKILITPFLQKTSGQLPLKLRSSYFENFLLVV